MRGGRGPALCRVRQILECVPPAGPEASESTVEENEDDIQFVSGYIENSLPDHFFYILPQNHSCDTLLDTWNFVVPRTIC